jgi:Flp pilus assembly protein TadG
MNTPIRLRHERGSTLVELPLALLWVFTVIFGLAESGRLMLAYTTLCDAARAGTRYAIVHGSYRTGDCTQDALGGQAGPADDPPCVVQVVQNVATAAGLSSGSLGVQVRYPDGTNKIGARVTVKVSYPFSSVLSLLVPFSVTIGSTSEGIVCY